MYLTSYYFNFKTKQKNYFKLSILLINFKHNENKILQVFTPDIFLGGKIDFLLQKLVHVGRNLFFHVYTKALNFYFVI